MNVASWPVSRWFSFSIATDFSAIVLSPPQSGCQVNSPLVALSTVDLAELFQTASTTSARPLGASNNSKPGHSHRSGCRGHFSVYLNRRVLTGFGADDLPWFTKPGVNVGRHRAEWAQCRDYTDRVR